MDNTDIVRIFDTTLRDGEQSPGASMNIDEKIEMARHWRGWAWTSSRPVFPRLARDFEAVRRSPRSRHAVSPIISALARATTRNREGGRPSQPRTKRIHTFLATSDIHMEYKLRKTRKQSAGEWR